MILELDAFEVKRLWLLIYALLQISENVCVDDTWAEDFQIFQPHNRNNPSETITMPD